MFLASVQVKSEFDQGFQKKNLKVHKWELVFSLWSTNLLVVSLINWGTWSELPRVRCSKATPPPPGRWHWRVIWSVFFVNGNSTYYFFLAPMEMEYFEFYRLPEVCRRRFFELLSPLNLRRLSFVDKHFNSNATRQIRRCLAPLRVNSNVYLKIENDDITVVNDATVISLNCAAQDVGDILVQLERCFPCKLLRLQRTENDCYKNGNLCEIILNYYFFTFIKLNEARFYQPIPKTIVTMYTIVPTTKNINPARKRFL